MRWVLVFFGVASDGTSFFDVYLVFFAATWSALAALRNERQLDLAEHKLHVQRSRRDSHFNRSSQSPDLLRLHG